jgi:hypothetical protein
MVALRGHGRGRREGERQGDAGGEARERAVRHVVVHRQGADPHGADPLHAGLSADVD